MIRITQALLDVFEADCFRRNAIRFVDGELKLFDVEAGWDSLAAGFDELARLTGTKERWDRATVVMLLFASRAFGETFTEAAIARLMNLSVSPEQRQVIVLDALRKFGYDAGFVQTQMWV